MCVREICLCMFVCMDVFKCFKRSIYNHLMYWKARYEDRIEKVLRSSNLDLVFHFVILIFFKEMYVLIAIVYKCTVFVLLILGIDVSDSL